MALGYRDTEYWTGGPGDQKYLDSEYLEEFYLDESTLVKPNPDGTYTIEDLPTGRQATMTREGMSDAISSDERDKSAFSKAVERSIDNNFGYNSLGKMQGFMNVASKAPGLLGMPGKVATTLDNQNNNLATNSARKALGLPEVSRGVLSQFSKSTGVVGQVQIGQEEYTVSLNPDPSKPNQISPQVALGLAEQLGVGITEVGDPKDVTNTKGILGKAVDAVKGVAQSVLGSPEATKATNFKDAVKAAGVNVNTVGATTTNNQSVQSAATQGVTRGPSLGVAAPSGDDLATTPSSAQGFRSPMGALGTRTTSAFGARSAPATGKGTVGSSNHKGVDISTPGREAIADNTNKNYAGAPMSAAAAGTVTNVGYSPGYGNFVDIAHKDGITTRTAHMAPNSISVSVGDQIAAGTPIGQMGTTGNSSAAHGHFEMSKDGVQVNPADYIDFDPTPSVATPGVKPDVTDDMAVSQMSMANTPGQLSGTAGFLGDVDPTQVDVSYGPFDTMNPVQDVETTMSAPQSIANISMQDAVNAGLAPSTFGGFTTQNTAMGLMGSPTTASNPATTARSVDVTSVSPSAMPSNNISPATQDSLGINQTPSSSVPAGPMSAQSFSGLGLGLNLTDKEIGKMSMAIAGELSPQSLMGIKAQDPVAMNELAGVVSTMNNRISAEINQKMQDPVSAALSPNNYNSLSTKALGTTMQNFSKFGPDITSAVQGLMSGTITAPSDVVGATHYANLEISDPSWAKTDSFQNTMTQVGDHTFGVADNMYSGISPSAGIGFSASNDVSDVSTGAMKSAAETYGDASQSMGLGASSLGGRGIDGLASDVGADSNALGGGLGVGGGYVDASSLGVADNDVSASGKGAGMTTSAEKADAEASDKADNDNKSDSGTSSTGGESGKGEAGGLGSSSPDKSDEDNDSGAKGSLF